MVAFSQKVRSTLSVATAVVASVSLGKRVGCQHGFAADD
jgi:hypothetical protein